MYNRPFEPRVIGIFLFILVFGSSMLFVPFVSANENSWDSKASLQQGRAGLKVAVVNQKIYAIGGVNSGNKLVGTNEEYDPETDTWSFKSPMPTPRSQFAVAVYNNKIYCFGGGIGNNQVTAITEVYDPETDVWETLSSMPTPRKAVEAAVAHGLIYLLGGNVSVHEAYNPTNNSWTSKASIPIAPNLVRGYTSFSLAIVNDRIHVIGASPLVNSHQIYDIQNDSWSFGTPQPTSSYFETSAVTTGSMAPERIFVFYCDSLWWDLVLPNFVTQIYDLQNQTWIEGATIPTGRFSAGVGVLNDKIYVIGGYYPEIGNNIEVSNVTEEYTPIEYIPEFSSWFFIFLFLILTISMTLLKKSFNRIDFSKKLFFTT